MRVQSPGQENLLEENTATHSTILARRIPWIEEPGRPYSIGLQSVRRDTHLAHIDEFRYTCPFTVKIGQEKARRK